MVRVAFHSAGPGKLTLRLRDGGSGSWKSTRTYLKGLRGMHGALTGSAIIAKFYSFIHSLNKYFLSCPTDTMFLALS